MLKWTFSKLEDNLLISKGYECKYHLSTDERDHWVLSVLKETEDGKINVTQYMAYDLYDGMMGAENADDGSDIGLDERDDSEDV